MSSASMFNFSGLRSPPRRPIILPSPTSPFCTSPSQLHEVTSLEDDTSLFSMGMRSPGQMRGRSIKEFEEQLTNLKKENFNLKLRIYFLEERMGTNFKMDQENAIKQNIELMVELESLKKELEEKQQLLCDAVKAIELEEEVHKKDADGKNKLIKDLQSQVAELQQQYDLAQEEVRSRADPLPYTHNQDYFIATEEDSREFIKELQTKINGLENQLLGEKEKNKQNETGIDSVTALQNALTTNQEHLKALEVELIDKEQDFIDLNVKLETAESELQQKIDEYEQLEKDFIEKSNECVDLKSEVHNLKLFKEEIKTLYDHECKKNDKHRQAITNRNSKIHDLESTVDNCKSKINNLEIRLQTAQNEVKSKTHQLQTSLRSPKTRFPNSDRDSLSVRSPTASANHSPPSNVKLSPNKTLNSSRANSSSHENNEDKALVPYNKAENSLNLDEIQAELAKSKAHISKLEQDQIKACKIIEVMLENRKKNTKEIEDLQKNVQMRDSQIQQLKEKLSSLNVKDKKSLQARISELNLTAATPASDAEPSAMEEGAACFELLAKYKALTEELESQKELLLNTLRDKDAQLTALQDQYEEAVNDITKKNNRIIDLEFEILSSNGDDTNSAKEKSDSGNEKVSFWIKESEEKDKEIERLEKELQKRRGDLQAVINNELWEKNREIEKLQKRFTVSIEKKDAEMGGLRICLADKTEKLKQKEDMIDELQDDLNNAIEEKKASLVELDDLRNKLISRYPFDEFQMNSIKDKLQKSEDLRVEALEVCNILSTRLEELAQFLDSLLKQKIVLGLLGNKYTSKIREFVDRSLEMSKSICQNLTINPDESLMQLSNLSHLLNESKCEAIDFDIIINNIEDDGTKLSIIPDHITLTYENHLNMKGSNKVEEQAEVIKVLRIQVENLKHEIDLRDNELSKRITQQSDQEITNMLAEMDANQREIMSPEKIMETLMSDKFKVQSFTEKNISALSINTSGTLKNIENNSDSESWSEPDRSVSKARIGLLDDESLKPKQKGINNSESTEFDIGRFTRTPSKKMSTETKQVIGVLTEQIGELKDRCTNKEKQLIVAQVALQELTIKHRDLEKQYEDEKCGSECIRQKYEDACKRVDELECKLSNAEKCFKQSEAQTEHLQELVKTLEETKQQLISQLESTKSLQNQLNELQVEKDLAFKAVAEAELRADEYKVQMEHISENLQVARKDVLDLEEKYKEECESKIKMRMQEKHDEIMELMRAKDEQLEKHMREKEQEVENILKLKDEHIDKYIIEKEEDFKKNLLDKEQEFQRKLKIIEVNTERQIKAMAENANIIQQQKFNSENEKAHEINRLKHMLAELDGIKGILKTSEERVKVLENSEYDLRHKLEETELFYSRKLHNLRVELDKATLQESEAILEKTRLEEQKLALERNYRELCKKEEDFDRQVNDLKQDFSRIKENFQKQVSHVQGEKVKLEMKVADLETINKDLKDELMKLQKCQETDESKSHITSPTSKILEMYLSKPKEIKFKSYDASEPNLVAYINPRSGSGDVRNMEIERLHSNSSPDLGIESDHGRFSSLEAVAPVTRPYLQPLKISDRMNQMLDTDNQFDACANDQCTNKWKEVLQENNYLKKKVHKQKVILEETAIQLARANQRKREVEKNICNQIHKTSQVLRKAKANLDSGSESDINRR